MRNCGWLSIHRGLSKDPECENFDMIDRRRQQFPSLVKTNLLSRTMFERGSVLKIDRFVTCSELLQGCI